MHFSPSAQLSACAFQLVISSAFMFAISLVATLEGQLEQNDFGLATSWETLQLETMDVTGCSVYKLPSSTTEIRAC